ncbi:MAG TPA: DUF3098 domain-containing protein [Chitinophagales bacterium]|nr:DUF3098 domain-containing protein [Chitinophagales bacterium]HMZ90637.1 DUF3098 domain-containing protein [Chitinophagales bacterium]HNA56991.1 DUF3098 domain-containing protein [Chitinophagales bacterium]HNE46346.1 DUF3098 domain-containing protein [Chitinophagales bacterium]HNF69861.1 DUF3098 domain-containing protein [Chitinophagales bacterium]
MDNSTSPKKETPKTTSPAGPMMVLGKQNYYLILFGLAVIIIGFILMSGGKSPDPNVFNADEVYSTRRIVVAPIVVILGFAIEIYAVFHKSKK